MEAQKSVQSGRTLPERIRTKILSIFLNLILIIFSFSCIYPILWLFNSSLKKKMDFNSDIIGLPKHPSLSNYISLLGNKDYHLFQSMINSIRTTAISLFLIVLFGFIVGYILSRIKFRGNRLLYVVFLMGMLIPIHSLLVPIYVVFSRLDLHNHWYTLIIPYVAFGMPIAVFLVDGYIKGIPNALEEAAAIDGSSFSRTMFQIILPVCKPILTTVAIIQTFYCWNEFSFALVLLRDQKLHTVPLAMTQFSGQFSSDYPKMMTGMLITMSPVIILYFIFSKQIIKGMVAGAVKG